MLRKPKLHNSWSVALWSVRSDKKDERERQREREREREGEVKPKGVAISYSEGESERVEACTMRSPDLPRRWAHLQRHAVSVCVSPNTFQDNHFRPRDVCFEDGSD